MGGLSRRNKNRSETLTIETTIHLHKYLKGRTFKKRAPTAVKIVRDACKRIMGTSDNRLEVKLNQQLWSQGIRSVPHRIRVRMERKRSEDEDAKEELYTVCSCVKVPR